MEKCPNCNNPIFKTKRITFNWLDVLVGLMIAIMLFWGLVRFIQNSEFTDSGGGKLLMYIVLAVVGLIGWIFSKKVRKQYFEIASCTRCDFRLITKIDE